MYEMLKNQLSLKNSKIMLSTLKVVHTWKIFSMYFLLLLIVLHFLPQTFYSRNIFLISLSCTLNISTLQKTNIRMSKKPFNIHHSH